MIDNRCIHDVETNDNPGVEYEIALFYVLCEELGLDVSTLKSTMHNRHDWKKIESIIAISNPSSIINEIRNRMFFLVDVSFETQNDKVGPADIVLHIKDRLGNKSMIGLSVKYANSCTLNVTGRNFISDKQISKLRNQLITYTEDYIAEMNSKWGNVDNWFRKRKPSITTDRFIDLVRDAVIENWPNIQHKRELFEALFHADSPIEFWVVTYTNKGYRLNTVPANINSDRINDISVAKYQTSYVAFYIDNIPIGHMQVKFNNGFVEKCKKKIPDLIVQGVPMSYGQPFSSWNFSVEE